VAQDSAKPDFWDARYRGGTTPWDAGGAPPLLARWLVLNAAPARVLVPGCGSGHEVQLFASRGSDVLAIDFSEAACDAARALLGNYAPLVRHADFFSFEGDERPFDLVYERAFLCALPRRAWAQWGRRIAGLVRPGGRLAGFFYFDDNATGPPFGITPEALAALLEPSFGREEDAPVPPAQSIPAFRGKERWQVWRRCGGSSEILC
jgi:SAM-dependent methyltransferase